MDRKWWTLVAVAIGVFMLLLDITIVNVALPDIETALDASLTDLEWVLNAYALMLAALLLTAGSLADLYGRRRVFAIGVVIFTLGSLLCGLATDPLFLSLARGAQGIGGAAMFATSLALLSNAYEGRDRGIAFAIFGAITGVAVAIGPVIGGALTSGLSWRWIFLVNIPVGVVALAVALRRVEESRLPSARRPDWPGFVTFSGALGALIYGLINSHREGWGSTVIVGCMVAAAVLLAAFVILQRVQREPMLELSLLRKPAFTGGLVAAFGISAALFAMLTYLTLYLQGPLGYSAIETGLRLLAFSLVILVCAGAAGRLTAKLPTRLLIGPGFVLVGAGLLLMRGLEPSSDWTHLLPGLIVSGAGAGLINVPLASLAVGVVEPARAGMASGVNSTFRQVGIATGIATLGSLFASSLHDTVSTRLAGTPLSGAADRIADQVSSGGSGGGSVAGVPAELQRVVGDAATAGFVDGLNEILLVGALLAFASAVLTLALIRQRDFVVDPRSAPPGGGAPDAPPAQGVPTSAAS